MFKANYLSEDCIYALSTPYASSAIAVFRMSGNGTLSHLSKILDREIKPFKGKKLFFRTIESKGEKIDDVLISAFQAGHGYTKEESAELSCHGALAVINKVDEILSEAGFRKALRGEFTCRAVRNGSMSLSEGEAVMELVESESEESRKTALSHLHGSLDGVFTKINKRILELCALFELQLDYSEDEYDEDINFPKEKVSELKAILHKAIDGYSAVKKNSEGIRIALAGKTNAGKSTLFNYLLKENRSIVSDKKGTTRDYISGNLEIEGSKVILFDTAGLNEKPDQIEKEGIKRTLDIINSADLVVNFTDSQNKPIDSDKYININNKCDTAEKKDSDNKVINISALTGEGINSLMKEIGERIRKIGSISAEAAGSERQVRLLKEILNYTERLSENNPPEISSADAHEALLAAGKLCGTEITDEDVLDEIFSKFCVGK